ncbi:sel1 repeat family protein [Histomonas meleagridis]|uniref:sel1 repeat family protein n=1 Tax=Histomonas meleagridis TaxID=135588 RepID=UPI00355A484B|nr:sel1 repeat family protein [Histomonas meleagridis]
MGKVYYYGKLGQEVNKEAARQIFEKHQDDAISLVHLGRIHHLGEGVPGNLDKAKEYYERAVEMNEPNAMNILGVIKKSEGDPEGAKLIERASELGHDGASFNIAISEINNPETRDKAYKTLKS